MVIPRELRDRLGLRHGPVELEMDGADLRVQRVRAIGYRRVVADVPWPPGRIADDLTEADGLLVIPADDGGSITDEAVRALRDADRR